MKYTITVEFDSEYIPSDVMEGLKRCMEAQMESLHDGTLDTEELNIDYVNLNSSWAIKRT